jgi:hypothetical protein
MSKTSRKQTPRPFKKQTKKKRSVSKEQIAKAGEKLENAKQELLKAENCWDDDRFIDALKQRPQEEKQKAFDLKLEIGTKILMIENAQIELVASRVETNSKKLESALAELRDSLQTLSNVTRILAAAGSLLTLLGKILALV